jgi:hypothetical protein
MSLAIFITILLFCFVNISILFFIKTRTSRVIAIISSHLIVIFLFAIYLKNFLNFKEFVLAIIIYSMTTLFLIADNKFLLFYLKKENIIFKNNISSKKILKFYLPISIIIFTATISVLTLLINAPKIKEIIQEKKTVRKNHLTINPLILPSHPVHSAVKKFYLGQKYDDNENIALELEINKKEYTKIKDSLKDNIMLKRISDIILIIIGFMCGLLIFVNKKIQQFAS